jgi:NAD(P)-dependent dehydrogenase (short-subunit alcohol dehydrogenase family)
MGGIEMDLLQNKVALITGASSGIGLTTAKLFAREGAKVAILARREAVLEEKAGEIRAEGGVCLPVAGDVTDPASVDRAVQRVMGEYGRIDVLVNNAGDGDQHRTTENVSNEFWDRMIALNQSSVFYFCRAVLPHMRAQGSGSIVNLSAIAGVYGNAGVSYSAAKAAVIAITKNIAFQYTGTNIRCNAVCPGPTLVPRMDGREDKLYDKDFLAITERHMDMTIPFATTEDQANVILFLASDLSRAMTGQAIITDNGRCL